MADTKISALPASTTPLAGTETLPVVQSGTTKKVSVANLTAGRQVGMSSYNMGITAFTPTAAGTISDGTDNSATEKITELLVVADDNTWKTSGASFATYRTWLNTTGIRMRVSNGAARYSSWDFTPAGNIQQLVAGEGINFTANTPAAGMTSQLLNWYEEGTWTPAQGGGLTVVGAFSSTGRYTRIGRQVTVSGTVTGATSVAVTAAGIVTTNLPFTVVTAGHGNATNAAVNASAAVICTTTNVTSANAIAATGTITFSATYFV